MIEKALPAGPSSRRDIDIRRNAMLRTRVVRLAGIGLLLLCVSLPGFAWGGEHSNRVVVQAPLDAANCTATPPTISVLGLTIDVSQASFAGECDDHNGGAGTCADLTVGGTVRVELAGDTPGTPGGPLTATEVAAKGGDDDDDNAPRGKIAAPLQA